MLKISTGKSLVPYLYISFDSIYDAVVQSGARFLEEISNNIDSFAYMEMEEV